MNSDISNETKCDKGDCTPRYAQAFVIYQSPGEDIYEPMEALSRGTIYPTLDMPYTNWRFNHDKK